MATIKKIYKNGVEYQMPQGPVGPQGATSVYDQTTQDFLTTLETTTGDSQTKTMTQKAITDAIDSAKDNMGEMVEIKQWSAISKAGFVDGNVITAASSSSTQACWWAKVSAGDKVTITATNSSSAGFRVAFTDVIPAIGVTVQGKKSIGGTSVNATIVSPIDGYMVLNHASDAFTNRVVKIRRRGDYTELQEKASLKTLMDVVELAGYGLSDVESTQVYSNSLAPSGNLSTKASDTYRTWEFPVQDEKLYHIHGRIPGTGSYVGYVFYDDQGMSLSHGEEPNGSARTFDTVVISPKGAAYLRVSGTTSINSKLAALVSSGTGQKTIFPKMSYDFLSNGSGKKGFFSVEMMYNKCVSTMRFIKVNGDFTVTLSETRILKLVEYDENFQYLRHTVYNDANTIQANVETPLSIGSGTSYVKIQLTSTVADAPISIARMKLKGGFPDNWDTFNISQFGCNLENFIQGRQLVIARVHVTDPTCCDNDSSDVQDTGEYFVNCELITRARWEVYGSYLWDFGRIFLPETYDNLGEPTRLIIYCHGAAVNYVGDGSVSAAEINDLDPTYWLAEGYAVLDVEGNPFDNENEHQYSPQSMDCYVSAYKWAIEHYNLKRDGVFLGGRSMGGSNAINLMRKQCPIPVIAACPNVPSSQARGLGSAVRKDFWAKCCGLDVPDGYVWGNGVYTDSDKAVLLANFDKVVKSTPIFGMVTDMPITEEFKRQFIDCYYSGDNNGREALWSSMHAMAPCPVKLFACYEDATAPPARGAMVYYNMFKNCGQIVELRLFHDSRYIGTTDERAHHYDTEDPAQRQDGIVTRYGTVVDDVPTVYIEMLRFWRRFEQE